MTCFHGRSLQTGDAIVLSEAQETELMTDLEDLVASDDSTSLEDGVLL